MKYEIKIIFYPKTGQAELKYNEEMQLNHVLSILQIAQSEVLEKLNEELNKQQHE